MTSNHMSLHLRRKKERKKTAAKKDFKTIAMRDVASEVIEIDREIERKIANLEKELERKELLKYGHVHQEIETYTPYRGIRRRL